MKEGEFPSIRKPKDPANEFDRTYVHGITDWRVILLSIPHEISYLATTIAKFCRHGLQNLNRKSVFC